MSAESKKINTHGIFPLQEPEQEDMIPKSKIIQFDFNTLEPKRRSLALRQIKIYEKKFKLFPHKKSLYIEEINKIIIYEINRVKNTEHV